MVKIEEKGVVFVEHMALWKCRLVASCLLIGRRVQDSYVSNPWDFYYPWMHHLSIDPNTTLHGQGVS